MGNIQIKDNDLLDKKSLELIIGDGWEGMPEKGPFDAIHVGVAAAIISYSLANQLKNGGRMMIPAGDVHENQDLILIDIYGDTGETFEENFKGTKLRGVR